MPGVRELESCNLGYAKACPRLPKERTCDAVRFAVVKESSAGVSVQFVLEANHLPAAHGVLEYDQAGKCWKTFHPDLRMQKLAESFLQSYLDRKVPL